MADINDTMVLTKEGLQTFAEELFAKVNTRIEERIADFISEDNSDDTSHMPSVNAVYDALAQHTNLVTLTIASGDPTEAKITPDNKSLYVVRKKLTDKAADTYVWDELNGFIKVATASCGDTDVDLKIISDEDIIAVVGEASDATNPGIS